MIKLNVLNDIDELSKFTADWISNNIKEVLKKQDRYSIVLSGGSTPEKLYRLLASDQFADKIEWDKIHFFWGDERYVPFTDKKNNARMAFDTLLNNVAVLKENIHIMQTDIAPDESAAVYEKILHDFFNHKKHSFDLVLLGLGDNAHTLSLFPGYDIVHEKEKWVKAFYLEEQKMFRISLTAPIVNKASHVVFLISGKDKAASVYNVIYGLPDPDLFPAQTIQPFNANLHWFLDQAAATDINEYLFQ